MAVFAVDQKTGLLTRLCCLPISGDYPKDIDVLPGEKTLVVLNHETNEIRFLTIDYEKDVYNRQALYTSQIPPPKSL